MEFDSTSLSDAQLLQINQICNDFEAACKAGRNPRVEAWLSRLPDELRGAALSELLPLEIEYRQRAEDAPSVDELATRFPDVRRNWLQELSANDAASPDEDVPEQLGDYRLLERIGGGGMGTVYKAVHQRMGRTVALKVLRREIQRDPALLQRFDREVRAAARLSHPNIVAALDAREENGLHYLITEFVAGCDLNETVRRHGPLSVNEAVDCIIQAARGLDFAHRQGVVHRDIKPANLLRDSEGVVKVLDMGLARLDAVEEPDAPELTKSGMVMGTAAYMAPEQGRDTRRADARSDIYSLGCTLYFLLTGRPVFTGQSVVDTILSHVSKPIPPLHPARSSMPQGLEAVFRRMVAKNPDERFQTAADVIAALVPFCDAKASQNCDNITIPVHATLDPETAMTPTVMLPGTSGSAGNPSVDRVVSKRLRGLFVIIGVMLFLIAATMILPGIRQSENTAGGIKPSLEFNGRSSYVAVRNLEPVAGETYTLEAVVEPRELSAKPSNVISWLGPDWMAIYLGGDGTWGMARRWNGESSVIASNVPAKVGVKTHLAGVFRGDELRLFVDGQLVDINPVSHELVETSGGLFIGGADLARLPEERFFRGVIQGVRISRGVRYSERFDGLSHFETDSNTLALFPFAEGRGTQTRSSDGTWTGDLVEVQWHVEPQ